MFTTNYQTPGIASKFDLKEVEVRLISGRMPTQLAEISLVALEAIRATRRVMPASRHGLEVICGSSCETGAQ